MVLRLPTGSRSRPPLERDNLERHTEDLCDLFLEFAILGEVVTSAAEPAPNDLLAKKL